MCKAIWAACGSKRSRLNTIAFGDPKAEKSLKPLALKNRGRFAFVP